LLQYINGQEISFNGLIDVIETPIFIQRMLGKMKELQENQIHIQEFRNDNGTISAVVRSYAVFDYVKGVLEASPFNYSIHPMLLNAIDYGAPQKRERFIIVGVKPGLSYEPPVKEYDEENFRTVRDAIADLQDIPTSIDIKSEPIQMSNKVEVSDLGKELRGKQLYNHVSTATRETAQARFAALKAGQNFHDLGNDLKTTYSNPERTQNTIYMRLQYDEPSGTVVNVRKSMWIHPELDRAVSIREAARLQTFPDTFVFEGTKDSQYQQVGNAVPPVLANAIAKSIADSLKSKNN
jgi:DNA (cytosine-5)-methyltransferase 1